MSLPTNWTLVTVFGTFTNIDGNPAEGEVSFESAQVVVIDDVIIVPGTIRAQLDENGYFEVQLPSTNDPDLNVTGWAYIVHERIKRGDAHPDYSIFVEYDSAPINLATVSPVVNAGTFTSLATKVQFNALASRVSDLEDEDTAGDAALAAETAARVAADATLTTNLANEVTARTNADTALATDLATEVTNRTADVDAEEAARITGDAASVSTAAADATAKVAAEATARDAAIAAAIIDSIADSDTTHSPSRNAVFDALALKQDLDADLTAIAALTTTSTGRSLLAGADEAAIRDLLKIGPRYCFEALADFGTASNFASANIGSEWSANCSGTSASLSSAGALTSGNGAGRGRLQLGTTATGRAAITTGSTAHALGAGAVQFVVKGSMSSLSDGTDTFIQRMGLMDDVTAEPANGCYFRYTDSVNGGKWECVTRKAGVETAADSGVTAVAGTERVWCILVDAAAANVYFYIDGALVQTIATNIPTARVGFATAAIRSAGTAAKNALSMDLIYARIDFTTPRW
jgi:hypothetical protein